MIDRYQVIYDMERCTCHVPDACRDCSLYNPDDGNLDCMERLMQNALTLLRLDTSEMLKEQKTGHWVRLECCSNEGVYCSECHTKIFELHQMKKKSAQYCGHCGAKMEEEMVRR